MSDHTKLTRRGFIAKTAAAGVAFHGLNIVTGRAQSTAVVKVALIGCGGRGGSALKNCFDAGKHLGLDLTLVAVADAMRDRATAVAEKYGLPAERRFVGFDGYRRLFETETDLVLIATPPNFRPIHFEAAVEAGKHVFMEKPVAVDPPGARRIIAAGELAERKGLAVVAGTQRRHQKAYRETQFKVANGAIGTIVGGTVAWCGGKLWRQTRGPNQTAADYMVKNWVSFTEMSGDHIVEQHVHNIDVANWFVGRPPVSAVGFGGRARRQTGNQFDFFSVDLDYGDGCHIHSMCRQVDGCYNQIREFFAGTGGTTWGNGGTKPTDAKEIAVPDFQEHGGPYVQEHVDLLDSIRKGEPLNEARAVAESTMTGIMGRISAYTGKLVRWHDLMNNEKSALYNLKLTPAAEAFESGDVVAPPDDIVAVPGRD